MTNATVNIASLVRDGEVVVISAKGTEEVIVQKGNETKSYGYSEQLVNSLVTSFKQAGWETVFEDTDAAIAKVEEVEAVEEEVNKVPKEMQSKVDKYLDLHKRISELTKEQEKLKKEIKPFMEENGVGAINGTKGRQVYLQEAKASNSTSRYTDYELADVHAVLGSTMIKEVTEIRINADKVDALLKMDKLPKEKAKELKAMKIVKVGSPRFVVKK